MEKNKKGRLITLEGISGIGKTTYFSELKKILKDNNIIFNDEICDKKHEGINSDIFKILSSKNSRFFDNGNPKLETLLICGKQVNDEESFVIPQMKKGKTIISDRGFDTLCILEGIIYSKKYKLDEEKAIMDMYNSISKICVVPDITIVFTGNFDTAIARAEKRDGQKYTKKEMNILKSSDIWFKKISKIFDRNIYVINIDNKEKNDIIKEIKEVINL